MGVRTGYTPGTFCWTDLSTVDAMGAKAFYAGLFGWEAVDVARQPAGTYTWLRLDGRDVCALFQRSGDQPPAWLSYVSVDDADGAAARAREAGATVVVEPFDVMTSGRMAVLCDPTGAYFAVWQAADNIGASLVNDTGCLCLNQLNTTHPDLAARFYAEVFGWRIESVGTDAQPYWGIFNGDGLNGGMMPLPEGAGASSHWMVYFTATDVDTSVATIEELGGRILVAPMPIPSGRIAVAMDPQGAAFALFEGRVDP
ncbi:MAG: VOC family protein [Actinomycetota bacterium]|nr:VOC family protein [Actinomycetota bacterium]